MITLKFKRIGLQEDDYGYCLMIQMVQIYKDGKFLRNAKINPALLELLKDSEITINLKSSQNEITKESDR